MNAITGKFPCAPARWIKTSCVSLRNWNFVSKGGIGSIFYREITSKYMSNLQVRPTSFSHRDHHNTGSSTWTQHNNALRKVFQQRFWIRIKLLKGLIFLASRRVPSRSNRSFSRFPLMESTSIVWRACVRDDGGKLENKALRVGCVIQGEEHLRLIDLNRSLNFSTSFSTRASLSTETQVVSGVVRWQKKKSMRQQSAEWYCQI